MPVIIRTSIPEITLAVKQALIEVVEQTTQDAKDNIEFETYRAHSGRMYPSRREPGALHQASAPGESFASDTASLVSGMEIQKFGLTNWLDFSDSLGAHRWNVFEFGSSRIAPRPTIVPMFANMEDGFVRQCAGASLQAATIHELKA
jgi:hypothetical protein